MDKIKYLFGLLIFNLFVPSVNALKYDIGTSVINASTTDKSLYEIKVSLNNISDTDYGVAACSMNIDLDGDIKFNGQVRTLGEWSMLAQDLYLFDTANPALKNTQFMIIPVKVSSSGTITLSNISCSDGDSDVFVENKVINLEYIYSNNEQSGNNQGTNNDKKDEDVKLDSNCDLSNIVLSEGSIEFDSSVTEYYVEVSSFESLTVEPELASDKASFTVNRGEDNITIEVVAMDGSTKKYTIYVDENAINLDDSKDENDYVPVFIAIICVLVLINIFRIVRNKRVKS